MAALTEPGQVGKREHLLDLLSVADQDQLPYTSMAPKGAKPQNTIMTWQVDDELDVDIEGVRDFTDVTSVGNASPNRATVSVYGQLFRADGGVGVLAEDISNVAAIPSEMARTVKKLLTKVKRSMEARCLSDEDTQAEGVSGAYETRGLGSWINNAAQGVLPVDSNFRTPTTSIDSTVSTAAATEAAINSVLKSIYDETGVDKVFQCFVGPAMRQRISDLQLYDPNTAAGTAQIAARTVNKDQVNNTIHKKIDIVRGDFGTLQLHTVKYAGYSSTGRDDAVGDGRMYIVDMKDINLNFGIMPKFHPLPDLGGGPRGYVQSYMGQMVGNPLKHGAFKPTAA